VIIPLDKPTPIDKPVAPGTAPIKLDEKTRNAINDPNVVWFLLPTPQLKKMIAEDEHPLIKALPQPIKIEFLAGHGWTLDTQMVIKFIEGRLDEKNTFLLKLGEIRVFGAEEVMIKSVKEV
jgi:hypothetical protein